MRADSVTDRRLHLSMFKAQGRLSGETQASIYVLARPPSCVSFWPAMPSPSPESGEALANRAVFLSYAREDTAAAQRIADALRSQGVEVWFDQSELRGGDVWDQKIPPCMTIPASRP